jgi:hypothetical protein
VHKLIALRVLVPAALCILAVGLHLQMSRPTVVFAQPSGDRQLIANVVGRRNFPYLSVNAYIEVVDGYTGNRKDRRFLAAFDALNDISLKIHSISWKNHTVRLDVVGQQLNEPAEYSF